MHRKYDYEARNRSKQVFTPATLIENLDADPRMPSGYSICRELSIFPEDRSELAQLLFDFLRDPTNRPFLARNNRRAFHDLAARFLTTETQLLFWPAHLIETGHQYLYRL